MSNLAQSNVIDRVNKVISFTRMFNNFDIHAFSEEVAHIHLKFMNDNIQNSVFCVCLYVDENKDLSSLFLAVKPEVFVKDKYSILRDYDIEIGDVFLPIEFKNFLH